VHQTSYTDHEIGKCVDNAVTRISRAGYSHARLLSPQTAGD